MCSYFRVKYLKHFLDCADAVPYASFISSDPCSIKLNFGRGFDGGGGGGGVSKGAEVAEI